MAEKHSCFLSVDTVRCSVIFSLLQHNFLDSAVVAQLSAFLAVFSFPLIRVSVCICCCLLQASQLHCVAATFANTLLFPPILKMKLSLAVELLHCIVISSLSHYRNAVFPGEDEAVPCRKIVALYSYFEPESLSKRVIYW